MPDQPLAAPLEPSLSQPPLTAIPTTHTQRSKKWLWVTIITTLVVLLGVGGYFAYARGYISIPGLSPKADSLFATMIEKIDSIENAEYGLSVSVDSVDRSSGAKPTFASLSELKNSPPASGETGLPSATGGILSLVDPGAMIQALPSDIHLQVGMTLQAETKKVLKDADGNLHLTGVYQGGDSTYNVDIEAKKVGENIYFILNKIPGLPFFDLTSIKGSWVALTPDVTKESLGDSWEKADPQQGSKQLQKYISIALKKNIVTVKKQLPTITVDGVKAAQYQIDVHVDQLLPVYQDIRADFVATNTSTTNVDQIITELQKEETKQTLQHMADASVITVAVDKVNGYLRRVEWKLTVVPPDDVEKLKSKQFVFDTVFSLNKINAAVNVSAPSPTMPWDEAMRKMTGVSKTQQNFQQQISRIRILRSALADYYRLTGAFPKTITSLKDDLQKEIDACKAKKESGLFCEYGSATDLNAKSITDNITNAPYVYTLTSGGDFALVYQIHLDSSIDSYSSKQYVEGKNTSTKKKFSVEGKYDAYDELSDAFQIINTNSSLNTNSKIEVIGGNNTNSSPLYSCISGALSKSADYDKDALTDYNEVYYYYTNPCQSDTDGDSYKDGDEVKGGFNPVGTGSASAAQKELWVGATTVSTAAPKITTQTVTVSGGVATVKWTTDLLADGIVNYGETTSYGKYINNTAFTLDHSQTFPVQSGKNYHYAIRSCVESLPFTTGCVASPDYTVIAP